MTGSYVASMRSALGMGLVLLVAVGCGGSAYEYSSAGSSGEMAGGAAPPAAPSADYGRTTGAVEVEEVLAAEPDSGGYGGPGGGDFDDWESVEDERQPQPEHAPARQEPTETTTTTPQYAQNQADGGETRSGGQQQQPAQGQQQETSDAVDLSQPLLIYTADLHLGVYEVEATQETILGAVNELGGHLAQRSDMIVVVRVPAEHFQQALDAIEEAGDVIHRNIEVLDVSEEYRDLAIRIRNAEAMRDRLEQLLRQANNVQEALAVERELQRITESIERMKGRLRFLSDRISYSTITVRFQALGDSTPIQEDRFRLPFPWLEDLGLPSLLSL